MKKTKCIMASFLMVLLIITGCAVTKSQIKQEREAEARYKLGRAYFNENNLQMAFLEFQKAINLNPNDKLYHYAIGLVYFKMEKFQDAINAYSRALTIDPMYAEAHNGLGSVYGRLNRWDEAISEYKKALNNVQYSTPQWVHYNMGYAYYHKEDYPSAMASFKEATKIQADVGLFHLWLGFVYTKLEMTKEAISAYEEARRLDSNSPDVFYNLGFAYFKEGLRKEALESFKKVVEISPNSEAAADAMKYIDLLKK